MFEKMKETKEKMVANVKEHGPTIWTATKIVVGTTVGLAGCVGFGVVLGKVIDEVIDARNALHAVEQAVVKPDESVDIYEKCNLPENWVDLVNQAKDICLIVSKETID